MLCETSFRYIMNETYSAFFVLSIECGAVQSDVCVGRERGSALTEGINARDSLRKFSGQMSNMDTRTKSSFDLGTGRRWLCKTVCRVDADSLCLPGPISAYLQGALPQLRVRDGQNLVVGVILPRNVTHAQSKCTNQLGDSRA